MRILDPELLIERVAGHPGVRKLVVTYGLETVPGDPAIDRRVSEQAVVAARDEHDAPVLPSPIEFTFGSEELVVAEGRIERRLERLVHRVDLDVEQDWWDTDQAGGTKPIAEFADHLAATVSIRCGDEEVARAVTRVVTGSWGALGSD